LRDGIKSTCTEIDCSLFDNNENSIVMSVPTFVDLQGFIISRNFVVKEFAALREGSVLSHYIFESSLPWSCLTKEEKYQTCWLIANHHRLQWEDGMIPYSMTKSLITKAVMGMTESETSSYTSRDTKNENGCRICSWTTRKKMHTSKVLMQTMKTLDLWINWTLRILCVARNMYQTALYKMYLKYSIGGVTIKNKHIVFINTLLLFLFYPLIFPFPPNSRMVKIIAFHICSWEFSHNFYVSSADIGVWKNLGGE